jgi:hypothetical protein
LRTICAAIAAGILAPALTISAARAETASDYTIGSGETHYNTVFKGQLNGRTIFLPPKDMTPDQANALLAAPPVPTVPYWSTSFTDQKTGQVFKSIFMVGQNPMVSGSNKSITAKVVVVPIIIKMGNTVFDPTKVDNQCEPRGSALTLLERSPLFNDFTLTVDGTRIGTGQYPDLFQRGNFFKYVKPGGKNPNFKLVLDGSATKPLTVTIKGGTVSAGGCGKWGAFNVDTWDNLAPEIIRANPKLLPPSVFPLFLFYNVVMFSPTFDSGCCILGFHSSLSNNGTFQAYGVGDFDSARVFVGTSDVSALSHEINEWQDDPAGGNGTPNWGHIGQVGGCQNNLEVGDPLSGNIEA